MGKCLNCGGEIPDNAAFCPDHEFNPGKTSKNQMGEGLGGGIDAGKWDRHTGLAKETEDVESDKDRDRGIQR